MGISISYVGSLAAPASATILEQDIGAMCRAMGWRYCSVDEVIAQNGARITDLKGISFTPHSQCEWVHFHMDPKGRFVNHFYYALVKDAGFYREVSASLRENQRAIEPMLGDAGSEAETPRAQARGIQFQAVAPELPSDLEKGVGYNWVKTQHAGPEAHVAVCRVLDHVKRRYAPHLKIADESGYFVHRDVERLAAAIGQVDAILHRIEHALSRVSAEMRAPKAGMTTIEDLLRKLEAYFADSDAAFH